MKMVLLKCGGHLLLLAGSMLCTIMSLVCTLVTDYIGLVSGSPIFLLFELLCAVTSCVKGNMPIFPSKIILPSLEKIGLATAHINMILGTNLLDWISLYSLFQLI